MICIIIENSKKLALRILNTIWKGRVFLLWGCWGGVVGVGDCVKKGEKWLIFLFGVIFLRNNWILVVYLHLIYKNENLN